jgi:hypothetical protein
MSGTVTHEIAVASIGPAWQAVREQPGKNLMLSRFQDQSPMRQNEHEYNRPTLQLAHHHLDNVCFDGESTLKVHDLILFGFHLKKLITGKAKSLTKLVWLWI